jgi:hypothetical protein
MAGGRELEEKAKEPAENAKAPAENKASEKAREREPVGTFDDEFQKTTKVMGEMEKKAREYGLRVKFAEEISSPSPGTAQTEMHRGISFQGTPFDKFVKETHAEVAELLKDLNGGPEKSKELKDDLEKLLYDVHIAYQGASAQKHKDNLSPANVMAEFQEKIDDFLKITARMARRQDLLDSSVTQSANVKAVQELLSNKKEELEKEDLFASQLNDIRFRLEDREQKQLWDNFLASERLNQLNPKYGKSYRPLDASADNEMLSSLYSSRENTVYGRKVQSILPGMSYISPFGNELFFNEQKQDDGSILYSARPVRTQGLVDRIKSACEEAAMEGNATLKGLAKAAAGAIWDQTKDYFRSGFETHKALTMDAMAGLVGKKGCKEIILEDSTTDVDISNSQLASKQRAEFAAALNLQYNISVTEKLPDKPNYKDQWVITTKEDKDGKKGYALHYFDADGKQTTLQADSAQVKAAIDLNSKFNPFTSFQKTGDKKLDITFEQIEKLDKLVRDNCHKQDQHGNDAKAMAVLDPSGKPLGMKSQAVLRIGAEVEQMLNIQADPGVNRISAEERAAEKKMMNLVNRAYQLRQMELEMTADQDKRADKQAGRMSSAVNDDAGASLEVDDEIDAAASLETTDEDDEAGAELSANQDDEAGAELSADQDDEAGASLVREDKDEAGADLVQDEAGASLDDDHTPRPSPSPTRRST